MDTPYLAIMIGLYVVTHLVVTAMQRLLGETQ
jgi:hypothetical protein